MKQLKIIAFVLSCILVIPFTSFDNGFVFAERSNIVVSIDGKQVAFPDAKPYLSGNRTLVPARFVSEQLGAAVKWDEKTGTVMISRGKDTIKLIIGSTEVVKNGAVSTMDVAPVITESRTMVPLRFVSEQLGALVDWNPAKNAVVITTEKPVTDTYIVKEGDTLWRIASQNGITVEELLKMNFGLNPDKLMIGQKIKIKSNGSNTTGSEKEPNESTETTEPSQPNENTQIGEISVLIQNVNYGITYERTDSLYRGQSEIKQAGVVGKREVTSRTIKAKDGSITKEVIKTLITQKPQNKIVLVGTKTPAISRGEGKSITLNGTQDEIVAYAKEFLGVPYVYGGASEAGFDCSGLTKYVTAHFGGVLPHSSKDQYLYGISVELEELQAGDLVFFEAADNPLIIGHVGIYIGNGEFIHAPQAGETVKISSLSNTYFNPRFYGAIRMTTASPVPESL